MKRPEYTVNVSGRLLNLGKPCVMGILNATPDSFFANSRAQTEDAIARRAAQMMEEGAAIIDVGGCSTRPGSKPVSEQEEMERLRVALTILRRECPDVILSIDTFRPSVAQMAVEEYGADIINDVSGGAGEASPGGEEMFDMVARLRKPYVLCSSAATIKDMLMGFSADIQRLRDRGMNDIILDPGFGFGKSRAENFAILHHLERLAVLGLPLLVGVSRKRMIYETLSLAPSSSSAAPDSALNGTTVVNTIALMKGANILRVHDVREAAECIMLSEATSADLYNNLQQH